MQRMLPIIPASLFGIVLGLIGLGGSWRAAASAWNTPKAAPGFAGTAAMIGEAIMALGSLVWLALSCLYLYKWAFARAHALAELRDPIQSGFVSLWPVSTMLVALACAPYWHALAIFILSLGTAGQVIVGVYLTSGLWRGGRDAKSVTPVLYLPGVASNFVTAIVAGSLGLTHVATLFFGAGFFYWLAIESVIVQRLATTEALPPARRPTLGILLAPPAVGCLAYLSFTLGPPDIFATLLYGYALFQLISLVRLSAWIWNATGFTASYWTFAFGGTAIATAGLRFVDRGDDGPIAWLATPVFIGSNLLIGGLALGTIALLLRGQLLPAQPPAPLPPPRGQGVPVSA